ncbi:MAG: L-serine ammonia-lyase, iron-sulfur-dependent, subunit alpha [Treponemataceae bacterium]
MGMTSIAEIYRIGRGPSSSHTMAPEKAARYMIENFPQADFFEVTLFGSLSRTGKGHRTDFAIEQTFGPEKCKINWDYSDKELPHPNTMEFVCFFNGKEIGRKTILSIGGGAIKILDEQSESKIQVGKEQGAEEDQVQEVYKESTFDEVAAFCKKKKFDLKDYVYFYEPSIKGHLNSVWIQMKSTVKKGLKTGGILPGGLNVKRRAMELSKKAFRDRDLIKKEHLLISSYAYAASEENAAGGMMVTSPTCGASGVLPAVLYYEKEFFGCTDDEIIDALAVAGIIGQVIKTNASVSGAEAGCQAEVGSACCMAAAALAFLRGCSIKQIECAAEISMEHCLGLTCDPVDGLVQIPCIERNAVGALRSYDAATLAEIVYDERKVSFDTIVKTMYETGKDLSKCYRETSEGGLAKLYVNKRGLD